METQLKKDMEKIGFTISKNEKNHVDMKGSFACLSELIRNRYSNFGAIAQRFDKTDTAFAGGTAKELEDALQGKQNMDPFFAARDSVKSSTMQKLNAVLENKFPKRKRVFSDTDGIWQYSRRFEPDPYTKMNRVMSGTRKSIEIEVDFSISCAVSAREIQEYGALVWAVSEAIEKRGIQTGITITQNSERLDSARTISGKLEVRIKKPNEYISPSFLAGCFTPNFYRRALFMLMEAQSYCFGLTPAYNLGVPVQQPFASHEKGKLKLGPSVKANCMEAVTDEILKALA